MELSTPIVRSHGLTQMPPNMPALTAIRFVLSLGVVLFHYQLQWPWNTKLDTEFFDRLRLGVDAFFILSGFVLTHAYTRAIERREFHYRRFLAARLARIYPGHLFAIAIVMVMVGVALVVGAEFDRDFYNTPGLIMSLTLVHAWGPEFVKAEWNGPSWSLSAEWFAYLLFPVFAWIGFALSRRTLLFFGVCAAVFFISDAAYFALFSDTVVHAEARMGIMRIVPEFLFGIALYRLAERIELRRGLAAPLAMMAAALLVLLMHLGADDRVVVPAAGLLLLALSLMSKSGSDGWLAWPVVILAGEASYALYLLHMPILIGWKGIVSALTGVPSDYVLRWIEVATILTLTLIGAVIVHLYVERPARDWGRAVADRLWPKGGVTGVRPGSQTPDL